MSKTAEEIIFPHIQTFTGNGDYYFEYVTVGDAVSKMHDFSSSKDARIKELEARLEEAEKVIQGVKNLEPLWMPIDFNEEHFTEGEALTQMKNSIDTFLTNKTDETQG